MAQLAPWVTCFVAKIFDDLKRSSENFKDRTKFFPGILEKMFLVARAAPSSPQIFGTRGAPPPTEIDRRAGADTMTSAHGSNVNDIKVDFQRTRLCMV